MSTTKAYVIELNEFNPDLLAQAAHRLSLGALQRMLSWSRGSTVADQDVEHQGLDPWVQWVSVHTEVPSQEHGVLRLGDVPRLQVPQIWERLSRAGKTTGVWCVMNGSRRDAPGTQFFFADPWTFSEAPYPSELGNFLALPGYYAKNYMALRPWLLLKAAMRTAAFVVRKIPLRLLAQDAWFLLRNFWRAPADSCTLFAAFDVISARLFQQYRRRTQPDVCFAFFNLVAHFQHHHWHAGLDMDWRTDAVFRTANRILSIATEDAEPQDLVLVLNGLSQRNVDGQGFFCYRPIDPSRFLRRAGIRFTRVEPCMTNDAHVFFASTEDRDAAVDLLRGARVAGEQAFFVCPDSADPHKLFYQVAFWGVADKQATIELGGVQIPFFSEFKIHAQRTGAHVKEGAYFVNRPVLPPSVENSRVLSHLWPATT
jgi:hypothetical protein